VAGHLSRLANEEVIAREIKVVDEFPDEKLLVVQERPWFADTVSFKAAELYHKAWIGSRGRNYSRMQTNIYIG